MNFETSKTLGGIGGLLVFISLLIAFVQFFAGLAVGVIGLILVLISLNGLANFYNAKTIFSNALYGVIAGVVGFIAGFAVLIFVVATQAKSFLQAIFPSWDGTDWTALQGLTPDTSNIDFSSIMPFLSGLLLVLVVIWIFTVIATFFIRRSLKETAVKSATSLFSTTGLLLLIGAILVIVIIGVFLVWIAALLLAIAFFTLKPPPPETQAAAVTPSTYA